MMKYSTNHPWKFRNPELAFFTGLLQVAISFMTEICNIFIVLANGDTQFDIIANFIIMLVIADFDQYFYALRDKDHITELIETGKYAKIRTWEVTTSRDAVLKCAENELKPESILQEEGLSKRE